VNDQPQPITELADVLAAMPGTVEVLLGGSRSGATTPAGIALAHLRQTQREPRAESLQAGGC